MTQMVKLYLASGSRNRQQALKLAGIPFISLPSNIDEKAVSNPDIRRRVVAVAKAKVQAVSHKARGLILGADGVNLQGKHILEKPHDRADAIRMLKLQSGKVCSFLTGYFILNTFTGKTYRGTSETIYKFRRLTQSEIDKYVDTEPVYTWAAAFSPGNSSAITFIDYVKGPFSTFVYSMPFEKLIPIFRKEQVL